MVANMSLHDTLQMHKTIHKTDARANRVRLSRRGWVCNSIRSVRSSSSSTSYARKPTTVSILLPVRQCRDKQFVPTPARNRTSAPARCWRAAAIVARLAAAAPITAHQSAARSIIVIAHWEKECHLAAAKSTEMIAVAVT